MSTFVIYGGGGGGEVKTRILLQTFDLRVNPTCLFYYFEINLLFV